MLELPEVLALAKQIRDELRGGRIVSINRGNAVHKWVWYNREFEENAKHLEGKTVAGAEGKGGWLFVSLHPGYVLACGDMGGRVQLHRSDATLPKRRHLQVTFEDGRILTVAIQGWGYVTLFKEDEVPKHKAAGSIALSPLDKAFTYACFKEILDSVSDQEKLVVKKLIISDPRFPGVGNGYLQDILFHAGIQHTRRVADTTGRERQKLYRSIQRVLREATEKGGKDEERDLFGQPGGYSRVLNAKAKGKPCPGCGTAIDKIQYLGGASYFCPKCQT